jgi:hypothetical protein
MTASPKSAVPSYWDLLDEEDRAQYNRLRDEFRTATFRNTRFARLEQFDSILGMIRQFAKRGDENDWRRFLVCGVCWLDDWIAINTRQLRLLVTKCKSSINGSLHKMGYTTHVSQTESWKYLFPRIPALQGHFKELRQWSVRSRPGATASMFPQLIPEGAQFQAIPITPAQWNPGQWKPVQGIRTIMHPFGHAATK